MESLARVHKHELELEPQEEPKTLVGANDNEAISPVPATHPEAANDNEVSQPISTLYPEAANDNVPIITTEDAAKIAVYRERLSQFAIKSEGVGAEIKSEALVPGQEEVPQTPDLEDAPSTPETEPNQPEESQTEQNGPELAVASAGANSRNSSGGASGSGTESGQTNKGSGSLLGKLWKLPFAAIKFAFGLIVGLPMALGFMLIKKLSGEAIKRGGYPETPKKKG